jgi:hypothetical protein
MHRFPKCPWIYTKKETSAPLPTMGELVGYDADIPQWEGDGEVVGVRSRMIITHSQDFMRPYGYRATYMTEVKCLIAGSCYETPHS